MSQIHVIAHTHWDQEWYFTRQDSMVLASYNFADVINTLEQDSEHLSDGTPLREVVDVLANSPHIVALGINCIALENTTAALKHLQSLTALPLVVYPNSGEHYDAVTKTWHHHGEACETLAGYLPQWLAAGAKLIGGCCRTTPKDIAELNAKR